MFLISGVLSYHYPNIKGEKFSSVIFLGLKYKEMEKYRMQRLALDIYNHLRECFVKTKD